MICFNNSISGVPKLKSTPMLVQQFDPWSTNNQIKQSSFVVQEFDHWTTQNQIKTNCFVNNSNFGLPKFKSNQLFFKQFEPQTTHKPNKPNCFLLRIRSLDYKNRNKNKLRFLTIRTLDYQNSNQNQWLVNKSNIGLHKQIKPNCFFLRIQAMDYPKPMKKTIVFLSNSTPGLYKFKSKPIVFK